MNDGNGHGATAGQGAEIRKTRLVYKCAAEAAVSERTARGVLFLSWPITSNARERAWRWRQANRALFKSSRPKPAAEAADQKPVEATDETREVAVARAREAASHVPDGLAAAEAYDAALAEEMRRRHKQAARDFDRIFAEAWAKDEEERAKDEEERAKDEEERAKDEEERA